MIRPSLWRRVLHVTVLMVLVATGVMTAQSTPEGLSREAGLDPDLQRLVEQIVGLRLSEEGLLSELSADDRARVLDAVARLLAPPPEVATADADGALPDPETGADSAPPPSSRIASNRDVASPEAAASETGGPAPEAGESDSLSAPGVEPPVRISDDDRDASTGRSAEDIVESRDSAPTSVGAPQDSVACAAWLVWDTNEDRQLSGADRYWRHFVIWVDDGDGVAEEEEMRDTFELGLRKLDLDLRSYEGAKDSTGVVERREVAGLERLRVELLRGNTDYGVLAIDLAGMVRGQAPRLRLRSVDGDSTRDLQDGFVPVQEGLEVEQVFGSQTRWRALLCDR